MSERSQFVATEYGPVSPVLRPLSRREIEMRIQRLTAEVSLAFSDVEPVTIHYLGQEILAVPLDTRKFVRLMSRHMSMN